MISELVWDLSNVTGTPTQLTTLLTAEFTTELTTKPITELTDLTADFTAKLTAELEMALQPKTPLSIHLGDKVRRSGREAWMMTAALHHNLRPTVDFM